MMTKKNGYHREPIFQQRIPSQAELAARNAKFPIGPKHVFGRITYDGLTDADLDLCHRIAQRGVEMGKAFGVVLDQLLAAQDIATCHCNHQRLKLLQFLMSDNADFAHDFALIGKFLDRRNGHLINASGELIFGDGVKL